MSKASKLLDKLNESYSKEELDRLNSADKKIHPVESQWHYPIMTKAGFTPDTKDQTGFVRNYNYSHPSGHRITITSGINSDYFTDHTKTPDRTGPNWYQSGTGWMNLKPHLKRNGFIK